MSEVESGRQRWKITREAFDALLSALGGDRDAAAERYERIRAKLIKYFAWARCADPDERADETLNRMAKRVSEGESIGNAESYVHAVARMVMLEAGLEARRAARFAIEFRREVQGRETADAESNVDSMRCLSSCLRRMSSEQRAFILEYYHGEQQSRIAARQRIAERLGIPMNAVRNRALRLREKLEACIRACLRELT